MEEEISLIEIFSVLKKWWKFIIGVSIVVTGVVVVILLFQPKTYQSYSILKIGIMGEKPLESVSEIGHIMSSQYICEKILKQLKLPVTNENLIKIQNIFKFEEEGKLLTIKVKGATPEEALKYVKIGTDILMERHKNTYEKAQKRLFESIRMIKKSMSPTPLSTSVSDIFSFNIPTTIEIPPQKIEISLPTKRRMTVITVFFLTLIATSLVSFLVEGIKKKS